MVSAHDFLSAYAGYLVATFGLEGLDHLTAIPGFAIKRIGFEAYKIEATGTQGQLEAMSKACEVFAGQTGKAIYFNGLSFVPQFPALAA